MLRPLGFLARTAVATLALAACAAAAFAAPARVESASPLKRYQARLLMREPMHEKQERRERYRELRELARELKRRKQSSLVRSGNKIKSEVRDEDLRLGLRPAPAVRRAAPARAAAPPAPNVRANNPTGDFSGEGQCETSIASFGRYLVAAWNDSKGWRDGTGQTQGWATSTDGGETWTDQGTLPVPGSVANWKWTSDPVVAVNPNTGAFYYCGLADGAGGVNAIGVLKGRFTGNAFSWDTRTPARVENYGDAYLDKQWLAVDPGSGAVYLTYTNFTGGIDQIEFQRADSSIATFSNALKLSAAAEDGYVQGSRPIVGAGGTVYVVYYTIGLVDTDYLRVCRSTNGGQSFGTPTDAVAFFTNFGTGAPGFNRDSPIPHFPGVAVDLSGGAHHGRLYLTWHESLNWFDDEAAAGTAGTTTESEPNETAVAGNTFTPGQRLRGLVSATTDLDWFKVAMAAGQTILVEADSSSVGLVLSLRMFAADGTTRLAWTTAAGSDVAAGYRPGWIWTAPASGTYYVRAASQAGTGGYRLRTGFATRGSERGSDQRDVFVAWSDNGTSWSTPVRVDDAPVGYDGWLPEVAVGPGGDVYCAWYDWRDAAPASSGGESSIYLARSADGGATWAQLGAASDTLSNWTACDSYLAPNQGDYMSLHAGASALAVCWSDARGGTPDTYVSMWPLAAAGVTVALESATAAPGRVDLAWTATPADSFRAVVERSSTGAAPWTVLDTLTASLAGHATYTDTTVAPGTTYHYRLGVLGAGGTAYQGQVAVFVPSGLAFALRGVHPNPTDGAGAFVTFTLPFAEAATLEAFDLSGRLVHSQRLTGLSAASHTLPFTLWPEARSGVYLLRITQRGHSLTTRVSLVR